MTLAFTCPTFEFEQLSFKSVLHPDISLSQWLSSTISMLDIFRCLLHCLSLVLSRLLSCVSPKHVPVFYRV